MSCYYHNCSRLSLWSNQSTGLKILHKGEPSALSSHILCGRPPAWWEVRLLLILLRSAGRKEVQSRGGGDVQNEGRKHTADWAHSPCPVHITTETTYTCSHAQEHIHTARVNIHIPSLAVMKHTSLYAENNRPCLSQACRPLRPGAEQPREWDLSAVWHWSWHVYWREQTKCGL